MLKKPESMEECVYFTNRSLGENGHATAWVFKELCPKCKKGLMGKPVVKGKVKIRAKEYVCPECNYIVPKEEYEETLTINIDYTCPECAQKGEGSVPFVRKKIKGIPTTRIQCNSCGANIDVTKKMKDPKK